MWFATTIQVWFAAPLLKLMLCKARGPRTPIVHSFECSNAQNWLFSAQQWCGPDCLRAHILACRPCPIGRCGRFFDGAARLKQARKVDESIPLPMLRMLLASWLRWIVPGLELKLELSKVFTHGEIKNKTIQGRASASWPIAIGII
jgi:hypothetical protein